MQYFIQTVHFCFWRFFQSHAPRTSREKNIIIPCDVIMITFWCTPSTLFSTTVVPQPMMSRLETGIKHVLPLRLGQPKILASVICDMHRILPTFSSTAMVQHKPKKYSWFRRQQLFGHRLITAPGRYSTKSVCSVCPRNPPNLLNTLRYQHVNTINRKNKISVNARENRYMTWSHYKYRHNCAFIYGSTVSDKTANVRPYLQGWLQLTTIPVIRWSNCQRNRYTERFCTTLRFLNLVRSC
jgi:hypothetical protein